MIMIETLKQVKEILEKIVSAPHGAWNNDPVTYRENVIKWCQDRAQEALDLLAVCDER